MAQQHGVVDAENQASRSGVRRLVSGLALASVIAGTALIAVPAKTVGATTTATGDQVASATVVAGVLTVAAVTATVVTNLKPGANNPGIALGDLTYTNTLNDGLAWSVTVSSTSWVNGSVKIPFTDMTVTSGTSITGAAGSTGTPTVGAGGALTGTDNTAGTVQSNQVQLASATAASGTQGIFTQTGSTIAVLVPATTATGLYTGTIQYTITG